MTSDIRLHETFSDEIHRRINVILKSRVYEYLSAAIRSSPPSIRNEIRNINARVLILKFISSYLNAKEENYHFDIGMQFNVLSINKRSEQSSSYLSQRYVCILLLLLQKQ